jgi:hypothetical protein
MNTSRFPRPIALALVLAAGACDSSTEPVTLFVPSVTLEAIGDIQQLEAALTGSDLLPVWEIDDPGVATVTRAGMITAVAPGTTKVWARVGSVQGVGTVTVLEPIRIEIAGVVRETDPSGAAVLAVSLKNQGGRGFYRMEHWQERQAPGEEHRVVARHLSEAPLAGGLEITVRDFLPGMEAVDWVVVFSREPNSLDQKITGCFRLDGGTPCPMS